MILFHGETILLRGNVNAQAGTRLASGTLTVTTHRVVFEWGGITPITGLDLEIQRVFNVHAGRDPGGLFGSPREFLTLETSGGRWVFEVVSSERWADAVARSKQAHPPLPPPPPPPPPSGGGPSYGSAVPVVINVAAPPAPKLLQQCRYCGASFDMALGRCDRRGARP